MRIISSFLTKTSIRDGPTRIGEYHLADETYAKLLERFDGHLNDVSDAVRANILTFYGSSGSPDSDKAKAVLASLRANPQLRADSRPLAGLLSGAGFSRFSGSITAIRVPLPGSDLMDNSPHSSRTRSVMPSKPRP